MILQRLYLENYKQFREPLELEPPEGAIGVVGANGAGKTTIFEAILWAFFGPRAGRDRFRNELIPWSGGSTRDRSVVRVTLDADGDSFTVERSLRSGRAEAHVLGTSGEELVGGPEEVTRWVRENLLGMDLPAFEATFFARQKELEFFSGITGVARQREVARLLGISRVERARELLNEDLKAARQRAEVLAGRLDEGAYRELVSRREELLRRREELEEAREGAAGRVEGCREELDSARSERERLEGLYREHTRLSSALQAALSERESAGERGRDLEGRLARLAEEEREVRRLEPELGRLPEVERDLARLEEARRKAEKREQLRGDLARARRRAAEALDRISALIEDLDVPGEPVPGWRKLVGMSEASRQAEAALDLLRREVPEAARSAEEHLRNLEDLAEGHAAVEEAAAELRGMEAAAAEERARLAALEERLHEVSGGEDLEAAVGRLREEQGALEREASSLEGSARADERQARNLKRAAEIVEEAGAEGECPTCHRGFEGEGEYQEVLGTLEDEAEGFLRRARETLARAGELRERAQEHARRLRELEGRLARWRSLREDHLKLSAALERRLEEISRRSTELEERRSLLAGPPPDAGEVRRAEERVSWLERFRGSRALLEGFVESFLEYRAEAERIESELEGLAGVSYEPAEHDRLAREKARLEEIRGTVAAMRRRIAEREELERRLEGARAAAEESEGRARELRGRLEELGFDEEAYAAAGRKLRLAEARLEEERGRAQELEREWMRLENALEAAEREISRHERDRKEADEQAALASRLRRMNELFKDFYARLGGRARPALQAETSEMVRTLTDGRYERVEFDEDYGILLFDGLSDAYGIERFSGGEADIVSLAARVALSKMISARSSGYAPGFIVLDEVFGSLDGERRNNVLLALDRLKRTFGQVFIISHVGDIQESALLDELWLVSEDEENKSTVQRVELPRPASAYSGADVPGRP